MGSPLAPILANIIMGSHERNWITNYNDTKPFFYRRHVDDIFSVFTNETEAMNFLSYIKKQHTNIKFAFETKNTKPTTFSRHFINKIT